MIAFVAALAVAAASLTSSSLSASGAAVDRATLANGLRIIAVRDAIAPVVTVEMTYLVGAVDTPPGFPGMAHAQEHMAFRGLAGLTGDQVGGIFAELGGDANAFTQPTTTTFRTTLPAADLGIVLHVEACRLRGIDDAADEWARERGAIEQEVARDSSSPAYVSLRSMQATAFAGTPYAVDGLGTRSSFDATTAGMLQEFARRWYSPNNAVLVIAGDIQPADAIAQATALLSGIPAGPPPQHARVLLGAVHAPSAHVPGLAADLVAYRLPGSDSPDFAAARVLVDALADKRSALGALVLRGRAQEAGIAPIFGLPAASFVIVHASFANYQGGGIARDLLQQIITDYSSLGVPSDLVTAAQRREALSVQALPGSTDSVADAWTNAVAVEGHDSPDFDAAAYARVTVADVNRVAKKYLDASQAISVVSDLRVAAAKRKPESNPEVFAPQSVAPKSLPDWAQPATIDPASLGFAATERTLSNGLHVIVIPQPESGVVVIRGRVISQPSLEEPQGKEGVAKLTDLMLGFAPRATDQSTFATDLDSIGADEKTGSEFGIAVLRGDFDRGVQLLAESETTPALSKQAFDIARASVFIDALTASAVDQAAAARIYPAGDPELRSISITSSLSLTMADVTRYYGSSFIPNLTTIVIEGPVTADDAVASVSKWFGSWRAALIPPVTDLPPVAPNSADSVFLRDDAEQADNVDMKESIEVVRSNRDYYPLLLANEILGGDGFASRLFDDLREQQGLVYSVGTDLNVGDTRSTFGIGFACDPVNVSRAEAIVRHDVLALTQSPPGDAELARAKLRVVGRLALGLANQDDFATHALDLSTARLPLDEDARAVDAIEHLSGQDVQAAFARWIRAGDFVTVVSGPVPH
ncbi:MAG TPA: pitrilysin family protein [Candidatus Eremiobacteraceae bacterium]|nr:pitrilysin family protein [Candidatus Eremiobacteraceae bacterium]